jgi:hypothetical protein
MTERRSETPFLVFFDFSANRQTPLDEVQPGNKEVGFFLGFVHTASPPSTHTDKQKGTQMDLNKDDSSTELAQIESGLQIGTFVRFREGEKGSFSSSSQNQKKNEIKTRAGKALLGFFSFPLTTLSRLLWNHRGVRSNWPRRHQSEIGSLPCR